MIDLEIYKIHFPLVDGLNAALKRATEERDILKKAAVINVGMSLN